MTTESPAVTVTSRTMTGGGAGGSSSFFRRWADTGATQASNSSQHRMDGNAIGQAGSLTVTHFYRCRRYLGNAGGDYLIARNGPAFLERAATMKPKRAVLCLMLACCLLAGAPTVYGQRKVAPMKKAKELVRKQEPPIINKDLADVITPDNSRVVVSVGKQRAYLLVGDQVYIDTPISSGKRQGMTPTGSFKISQKNKDHRSSLYGDFVDRKGRVVRAGISTRVDSAPSGTRYVGAPMKYFCRFNGAIGMHVGILPGYPASHGCVRLPANIAPLIYEKVKIGTQVDVVAE